MRYQHTHEEVADFFNKMGFPRRKSGQSGRWTGPAVAAFYRNPILFGKPFRNAKITAKKYETGRRRSVKNPDGPIHIDRPDLAFLDQAIEPLLKARFEHNSRAYRRARDAGDPLEGVARNRSRFPGHCLRCWYCGREYVWGANGQRDRLMCGGARQHLCWNSTGVDGNAITAAVTAAIVDAIEKLPGIEAQLLSMLEEANHQHHGGEQKLAHLRSRLAGNKEQQQNLAGAVARRRDNESLIMEMDRLVNEAKRINSEIAEVERSMVSPVVPKDLNEIIASFRAILAHDVGSYELAALLRPMVVSMDTHLVRLIDSAKPIPRTRVVLNLLANWPDLGSVPTSAEVLTITLNIDGNAPFPQRCKVREAAVDLIQQGMTQRQAAARLGVKQPVIEQAARLSRMMSERGLDTPFVPVISPDELGPKHRRHLHHRYKFQPLEGYVPRPL